MTWILNDEDRRFCLSPPRDEAGLVGTGTERASRDHTLNFFSVSFILLHLGVHRAAKCIEQMDLFVSPAIKGLSADKSAVSDNRRRVKKIFGS